MRMMMLSVWILGVVGVCQAGENAFMAKLVTTQPKAILVDGSVATQMKIEGSWKGGVFTSRLVNPTDQPVRVGEVVLADFTHDLAPETPIWGEGFTMLAQTDGTLGNPRDCGPNPDRRHYRMYEPEGLRTVYGCLMLEPTSGPVVLVFTSCNRFNGRIGFNGKRLRVSLDCEGRELAAGASWELESFAALTGQDREKLLDAVTGMINANHPRLSHALPLGWCSWYCYGPNVTKERVEANLAAIATKIPELRYIQIDDGYQPSMGDWLEPGKKFGGDIKSVLGKIRERGFEPAIWVAPFIASPDSKLLAEHPEWFVKGPDGKPLRSDKRGFGGWRMGPWYCLDGTHPEAQKWLEMVFRTMRKEWGCTYFKLDANYWGAIHGGTHYDPSATRIEAYRRGMEAILRGAGKDSFILGCNHPVWPSLGLVHGVRTSGDVGHNVKWMYERARENVNRAWQNNRLWWVDPDCALIVKGWTRDQQMVHLTSVWITGGMVLSGDDLSKMPPERMALLKRLIPPTGRAPRFDDLSMSVSVGRMDMGQGRQAIAVFNWTEEPTRRVVKPDAAGSVTDFWSGEKIERVSGQIELDLPPQSARLLMIEP
jgi:alpha-galactosidase